jgi:hypothetical protein
VTQGQQGQVTGFDTGVASAARVYDYLLGGKDNFQADRDAGEAMIQHYPDIVKGVRMNRAFLGRTVHYLAADAGIRQFLDIGTGLPSANNTHEVAQRAAPDARVVYVDNDPIVLSHAQALLASAPEGACAYIDADIRDTEKILRQAASTLDFGRPIAICLIMVLQFIPDEDDPWQVTRTLINAVPPGSSLTVAHPASDIGDQVEPTFRQLNTRMGGTKVKARSHQEVARFFDGLQMVEPGLVQLHRWRHGAGVPDNGRDLPAYGGVARKP